MTINIIKYKERRDYGRSIYGNIEKCIGNSYIDGCMSIDLDIIKENVFEINIKKLKYILNEMIENRNKKLSIIIR